MSKIFHFTKTSQSVEFDILPIRTGITATLAGAWLLFGVDYYNAETYFVFIIYAGPLRITITYDKDKEAYLRYFTKQP